eukprot:jgi/Chlat1/2300/Chrsp17S08730
MSTRISRCFGEKSPERRGAEQLHNFFTYVAVRIVLAQLQAYNPEAHRDLRSFVDAHSLSDGDAFLVALMRESPAHAMRVMEVRAAYAEEDFEWDNLQRLATKGIAKANSDIMRRHVSETANLE